MVTLVDSNIFLDFFNSDPDWYAWSYRHLEEAVANDDVFINQIIYSEISVAFENLAALDLQLVSLQHSRESLPWEAAQMAGKAYVSYRRQGGERRSPLPDFYIGAHAAVKGYKLLTRDTNRYRTYFPLVDIIAPDTHP